jgi:hypothetical protein
MRDHDRNLMDSSTDPKISTSSFTRGVLLLLLLLHQSRLLNTTFMRTITFIFKNPVLTPESSSATFAKLRPLLFAMTLLKLKPSKWTRFLETLV